MATMIGGKIKQASNIIWQNVLECDILGRKLISEWEMFTKYKHCTDMCAFQPSLLVTGIFYLAAEDYVGLFNSRNGISGLFSEASPARPWCIRTFLESH